MSELKRCPFCGGELGFRTWIGFDGESYSLKCSTKDCLFNISSFKNKKDLIKKANTRKTIEKIVERLKESLDKTMEENSQEWDSYYRKVNVGKCVAFRDAIEIVKEEGGMNE